MPKKLQINKILIFYDLPELFSALDAVGTTYLFLLVDFNEDEPYYIGVAISKERYLALLGGKVDLREVFKAPETGRWLETISITEEGVLAKDLDIEEIAEDYLPESDFFLSYEEIKEEIKKEAIELNNCIVHLALSDALNRNSIEIETLGDFVKLYQSLVKYSYKTTLKERKNKKDSGLDAPSNYVLRAFAASPGSFNIHLVSTSNTSLFGNSYIEFALEKVDQLTQKYTSEEELLKILRTAKGHAIGSLKKLLEKIIKENVTLKYKWYSLGSDEIHQREITKSFAEQMFTILQSKSDLSEETKIFRGIVEQADIARGSWRIHNEEDGEEYSGSSDGEKLSGITLKTARYEFICVETIEELKVSEKEKSKFELVEVRKLDE